MSIVKLTSHEVFIAPLEYHNNVALFLRQASYELPTRAAAILNEIRQKDAQYADQVSNLLTTFAKRLSDEADSHTEAVTFLQQQYAYLAQREANISTAIGATTAAFPPLPTLPAEAPAWLQIIAASVHSCFDEFRALLDTYEHTLYSADQTLHDIEHILWQAINHPEQLDVHVDWSGNPFADAAGAVVNWGAEHTLDPAIQALVDFIRDHEGEIRGVMDAVQHGVEFVLLPPVDGRRFQEFIDYVSALARAYEQHVRQPFAPTTQAFAESYTPPADQMSYLDSLGSVVMQQAHSAGAFTSLLQRLQHMQTLNEEVTVAQIGVGTNAAGCLVALGALVAFPPDFPVSFPPLVWLGEQIGAILDGLAELWATISAVFAAIGAILDGIPLWAWAVGVVSLGGVTILLMPAKGNVGDSGIIKELQEALGAVMNKLTDANRELICATLKAWYQIARAAGDQVRAKRIKKTQKAYDCREHRD